MGSQCAQEMGGNHQLAGGIASDIQQPSQSHWPEGLGTSNDDLYTGIDSEAHDAPTAGIGTHAGPSGGGSTSSATTGSVLQNAGDEATSPGGTHYTAKSGLELKMGGMAGVSDDNKRFLLPSRETGYDYATRKSQPTEDQRNGMRALLEGVRVKGKASEALGKVKNALFKYQKEHAPDLINQKRSDAVQKVKKEMGSEKLSAAIRKGKKTMGPRITRHTAIHKMWFP